MKNPFLSEKIAVAIKLEKFEPVLRSASGVPLTRPVVVGFHYDGSFELVSISWLKRCFSRTGKPCISLRNVEYSEIRQIF